MKIPKDFGKLETEEVPVGFLRSDEFHPIATIAVEWFRTIPFEKVLVAQEVIAMSAKSGNRTAEICHETMTRLMNGQVVSDRYLLSLLWLLRDMIEQDQI